MNFQGYEENTMIIYGVGILALCTLVGTVVGDLLGILLGVKSNVGGVGIAMILLIFIRLWMHKRGLMIPETEKGVTFWGHVHSCGRGNGSAAKCSIGIVEWSFGIICSRWVCCGLYFDHRSTKPL
jgi:malonate transporter MadL subunit